MTPQAQARLAALNAAADDWTATCRKCGKRLKGRLSELKCDVCQAAEPAECPEGP